MGLKLLPVALLCASAAFASQWEIGGAAGYGAYHDVSVIAPNGTAEAGIRNRFVLSAVFGEDLYQHLSGEVRYLYQDGDPFVSAGGIRGNVQGQSHALDYSLLFQFRDRERKLRPYVSMGVGAKYYRVSGPEPFPQPLPDIAALTRHSQWRALATPGAGLKYRAGRRLLIRGDFRDYITGFPTRVIAPVLHGTGHGIFQQFTILVGASYWF